MNYTEPFLRKVETAQEEEQQQQQQSGVSYRAAVAAKNEIDFINDWKYKPYSRQKFLGGEISKRWKFRAAEFICGENSGGKISRGDIT